MLTPCWTSCLRLSPGIRVDRFLGGLVSPFTVKNADLAGTGPEVAWRVGNKVAYKTDSLVGWLVQTMGVQAYSEPQLSVGLRWFTASRVASGNRWAYRIVIVMVLCRIKVLIL